MAAVMLGCTGGVATAVQQGALLVLRVFRWLCWGSLHIRLYTNAVVAVATAFLC
jgi:hypothetical protein